MVRQLQGSAPAATPALALAVAWCTAWLVVGVWVGYEIWQLAHLGEVLARSGQGLDDSGRALQELRDLPVIGGTPGVIGDEVRATAAEVVSQGRQAQDSTRRLAVLIGLTIALLPALPAVVCLWALRHRADERRRVAALVDAELSRRGLRGVGS